MNAVVGVILFSDNTSVHFPVTQHTTASTVLPALNPGLPYSGGSTNTQDALNLLRTAGQTLAMHWTSDLDMFP